MTLAIITCHYNLAGYVRPVSNLRWFLRFMKSHGVDVYGVEAVQAGKSPVTSGMKNWRRVRLSQDQLLWQKEALLNLAEKIVPDKYDAVAWVDADVWFERADWRALAEEALQSTPIIQLFTRAHRTDVDGKVTDNNPSAASEKLDQAWRSHPGFAWAMRRDVWRHGGGLYPFVISGGCDTVMALSWMRLPVWEHARLHYGRNPSPFQEWAARYSLVTVSHIAGDIYHLWHGSKVDRSYAARCKAFGHLDHATDLKIGTNGLVEWGKNVPNDTKKLALDWFQKRREDGVDLL